MYFYLKFECTYEGYLAIPNYVLYWKHRRFARLGLGLISCLVIIFTFTFLVLLFLSVHLFFLTDF
jgi:hypothetical protein